MQLISLQNKPQIESDRIPWLCGACNYYTECMIREADEPVVYIWQYEYCHTERKERSYLPDNELILIETSPEADWECDCDENFAHWYPEIKCEVCGINYDDPTE